MKNGRLLGLVCVAVAASLLISALPVAATPTINTEVTQTWVASGDTKVHAVATGDVDGDGTVEIVTVGEAYTGTKTEAQLRIWSWSGSTLTLEKTYEWSETLSVTLTVAYGVFIGNLDASGGLEMVVVGATGSSSGTDWMIRVFQWDGSTLTSYGPGIANAPGEAYYGVYAVNLVGDSKLEIIAVGDVINNPHDGGIWIWTSTGRRSAT